MFGYLRSKITLFALVCLCSLAILFGFSSHASAEGTVSVPNITKSMVIASLINDCSGSEFPDGSYRISCINCVMKDNNKVLQADCRKGTNEPYSVRTEIRLKEIANIRGNLEYKDLN